MTDRESWLMRTPESAIDPELPICDPHHHLWDLPQSRYLIDELEGDITGGHRVLSTVFVECGQQYRAAGPPALRPVGETDFVERLVTANGPRRSATRFAAGIVAFADLTLGAAVQATLEAHRAASTRFRGVRYAAAWDPSGQIRPVHTNPPQGLLADRRFREGFARLADLDLSFDVWLYHPQFPELADLARCFPETTIVLDHMGGPIGIGPYAGRRDEVFACWRSDIAGLSDCANVVVKLGGRAMTQSGFGWHKRPAPPGSQELAAATAPYFETCIEFFGARRCMFESNFPMDRVSCSYTVLWNAFKRVTQSCPDEDRRSLFHDTAERVYRLDP
ncbi:MAG: amidohydrolase [Gammaproteobacteria bacterium]|nr:amidohydrolase [Gammaproteobacteria bacterium]